MSEIELGNITLPMLFGHVEIYTSSLTPHVNFSIKNSAVEKHSTKVIAHAGLMKFVTRYLIYA